MAICGTVCFNDLITPVESATSLGLRCFGNRLERLLRRPKAGPDLHDRVSCQVERPPFGASVRGVAGKLAVKELCLKIEGGRLTPEPEKGE